MPLFRSKKKSAQAATSTIPGASTPSKYSSTIVEAGQGRTTAGAERPAKIIPSTTAASSQAIYQSINAHLGQIRLLEVLPGTCPQTIKCVLRPVCLFAPAPQYETVSYCWGEPNRGFPINLNGRKWLIPASAGCVLHRVRLPDRSRLIWIDAVCINQDDDIEKGQQVSIMGDIYRGSKMNIVYFGLYSNSGLARSVQSTLFAVLADMKRKVPQDSTLFETVHRDANGSRGKFRYDGKLLDTKIDLKPLNYLYSDRWFSRIWVVQEVALSRTSICYFGDVEFSLPDVLRVAIWLSHNANQCVPSRVVSKQGLHRACNLWLVADHEAVPKTKFVEVTANLGSICVMLEAHEATNPKDMIYGLLGLHGRWKPRGVHPITPRYQKSVSVSEVYRDATRFIVEESGGLLILQYRSASGQQSLLSPDTPSWVVDFTRLDTKDVIPKSLGREFTADDGRSIKECTYLAPKVPSVLSLAGFTLDRVEIRTRTMIKGPHADIAALKEVLGLTQRLSASPQDIAAKLARTLIGGRLRYTSQADSKAQPGYDALMGDLASDLGLPPLKRERNRVRKESEELLDQYLRAYRWACEGRCFFLTSRGYMGLGPAGTEVGDPIVVFYGGRVPFVMQPVGKKSGNRHRLLEACYVDGIMNGEAMREHKASWRRDEVFHVV